MEHELRSVGARREDAWTVVLPDAVLLGELLAVDGLASKSVTVSDVLAEPNMIWDYTVDDSSFVVERHAGHPYTFLAGTESPEVLRRQRVRVGEELYHDTADRFGADGDVEEN